MNQEVSSQLMLTLGTNIDTRKVGGLFLQRTLPKILIQMPSIYLNLFLKRYYTDKNSRSRGINRFEDTKYRAT